MIFLAVPAWEESVQVVFWGLILANIIHLYSSLVGNHLVDTEGLCKGEEGFTRGVPVFSCLEPHAFIMQYLEFSEVILGHVGLHPGFCHVTWDVPDRSPHS